MPRGSVPFWNKLSFAIPRVVLSFTLAIFILGSVNFAHAQAVSAGFTGTVTDPSGSAIPGAQITATDTNRGTTYKTQTNSAGVYNLPQLIPSTYNIKATAKGFSTATRTTITLQMNQLARVDFSMKVGAVTQSVEVTGAPPLMHTDTMQVNTVITGKVNAALPLATRNYVELTLLAPGSTNPNPSSFTGSQTTLGSGRPYINGNREQADNFLLDGMDNNQVSDNLVGYTPSVDAIQEFNMITQNAPAEYGNFMGAIISTTIKSGTNQYHGDAFEFLRNDILNAANWSNNITSPSTPKDKLRWNEFGGTFGGPIKKDKLFFFGDYQGSRYDIPSSTSLISVFTPQERAGDFGQICSTYNTSGMCTDPNGIQLYNPNQVSGGNRAFIPYNNLANAGLAESPVANNILTSNLYPTAINGSLRNNQLNTTRSETLGDQFDVRMDYNATSKDLIFGRFSWSRQSSPSTNTFPLFYDSYSNAPTRNGVVDWTRTISPSIVNDARIGINYVKVHTGNTSKNQNLGQQFGIADNLADLPSLQGFTYANGIGTSNVTQLFADTVIQAEDQLVMTHGHHTIHTGFQYWRERINTYYSGNYGANGLINFDGRWTAGPSATAAASGTVGFPEADFWLGLPEAVQRGVISGTWGQRSNVFGAYIQDDWRARPDLTLNAGLRYGTHTPWGEVHNRQANFGPISGTEYFAGKSGCPYSNCNALYNSYNSGYDFQPRLGFAWTPSMLGGTTVVRGAYTWSTYLEGTGTNLRLPLNPPFNEEYSTIYDNLTYPGSTLADGFSVLSSPSDPFAGAVIRLWDPNVRPALSQQWNFSVEHQFAHQTVLQVGYVGQKSTHLMVPMPYFQRRLVGEAGCTSGNATYFNGGSVLTCASPFLSGNPALASIGQISGTESNGTNEYNAMQVTLNKRFSHGLQYQVAYTYGKCMTNSSGYYGSWGGQVVPTSPYFQNLYDMKSEWGPCYWDVTHMLTSYAVYQLPFGHKQHFGSSWNPVVDGVLGNWQVSGILQVRGGFPSTVSGSDNSGTSSRGARANCVGNVSYPDTPIASGGLQWVSPSAFSEPAVGTFGTCGVATIRGPGLSTFDLSMQKDFPFTESKRLQFRAEFVNFTNTPILESPSSGLGGSFGQITGSQGARTIQFGLKFYY